MASLCHRSVAGKLTVKDLQAALTLSPQQIDELLARLEVDPEIKEISREQFESGFSTFMTSQVRRLKTALTVGPRS